MIITEQYIKTVLGYRIEIQEKLQRRIRALYQELDNMDERIRSVSLSNNGFFSGGSSGGHGDLGNVLIREKQLYYQQATEVREILIKITDDLESINRIWICYQALDQQSYDILTELYVKKRLYHAVEEEMQLNHRKFESERKGAIQQILKLYKSNQSNQEIIRMHHMIPVISKKQSKKEFEQLTIFQCGIQSVPESGTEGGKE